MGISKAIKETLKGNFVSRETQKERLDTCRKCDERDGHFCGLCDCLLVWKTTLKTEECPDKPKKWGQEP